MPRLDLKDAKKYPAVVHYFQDVSPHVHRKTKVWKAFLKWSQLPEKIALQLVAPGSLPIIDFAKLTSKSGKNLNGRFRKTREQYIELHDRIAVYYETAKRPEWHKAELVLESTALHEMVHFGNNIVSVSLEARDLKKKTC
jgi:hypothetical protein